MAQRSGVGVAIAIAYIALFYSDTNNGLPLNFIPIVLLFTVSGAVTMIPEGQETIMTRFFLDSSASVQNQQLGVVCKSRGKQRVNVISHLIVVLLLVSTVVFGTEAVGTDSSTSSPSKAPNSVAPTMLSSTSTPKPVITPLQKCLFGLANSKFDLFDTEKYNLWMDNETTFELAETGVRKLYTWDITILVTIEQQHYVSFLLLFTPLLHKDLDRAY